MGLFNRDKIWRAIGLQSIGTMEAEKFYTLKTNNKESCLDIILGESKARIPYDRLVNFDVSNNKAVTVDGTIYPAAEDIWYATLKFVDNTGAEKVLYFKEKGTSKKRSNLSIELGHTLYKEIMARKQKTDTTL